MLESLPPARRRLLLGLVVLVVVATGAAVLALVRGGRAPEVDQAVPGPVVVVPGYGGDVGSVEPVRRQLTAAGREVSVVDTPGDGTGDLRDQARALAEVVDEVLAASGADSVDLVGYSAGGVVARWYVRELDGADVVRRVVTLGSPHHGTDNAATALAAAGSCPPACEQLAPDSDLLRRLNAGDETPAGPRWATLRTQDDTVVVPVDSAALEGATNVLVQQVCPAATTTHGELPGDPVTRELLAAALGEAAPSAPTSAAC